MVPYKMVCREPPLSRQVVHGIFATLFGNWKCVESVLARGPAGILIGAGQRAHGGPTNIGDRPCASVVCLVPAMCCASVVCLRVCQRHILRRWRRRRASGVWRRRKRLGIRQRFAWISHAGARPGFVAWRAYRQPWGSRGGESRRHSWRSCCGRSGRQGSPSWWTRRSSCRRTFGLCAGGSAPGDLDSGSNAVEACGFEEWLGGGGCGPQCVRPPRGECHMDAAGACKLRGPGLRPRHAWASDGRGACSARRVLAVMVVDRLFGGLTCLGWPSCACIALCGVASVRREPPTAPGILAAHSRSHVDAGRLARTRGRVLSDGVSNTGIFTRV